MKEQTENNKVIAVGDIVTDCYGEEMKVVSLPDEKMVKKLRNHYFLETKTLSGRFRLAEQLTVNTNQQ